MKTAAVFFLLFALAFPVFAGEQYKKPCEMGIPELAERNHASAQLVATYLLERTRKLIRMEDQLAAGARTLAKSAEEPGMAAKLQKIADSADAESKALQLELGILRKTAVGSGLEIDLALTSREKERIEVFFAPCEANQQSRQ